MMKIHEVLFVGSFALTLSSSCLRPTQERAERDLEVGVADVGDVRARVVDGLAAIRAAEPGRLALWLSAPTLRVELDVASTAPTRWRLDLENCMADLELSAVGPDGAALAVTAMPSELDTRKSFELDLVAGAVELRLTSPDQADLSPWRFAVMSDVQEAIPDVRDIYDEINATPNLRYLLGAGDLTQDGTDEQFARFRRELEALRIPYYTTLGNHDLAASHPYQQWFGRGSFSYSFREVRFSMLDSASGMLDPLVYEWLDGWLSEGRDQVHVVAMHVPPLDPVGVRNGSFASRNEAAKLLKRLADGRVDITLYGHIHSYYSFDNAGIPAYVSGGGGAIPERFDDMGRHFLVVEVNPRAGIERVEVVRVD